MENAKQDWVKHLTGLGYEFNVPRGVILEKLRRRMGEGRFERVFAGVVPGASTSRKEEFYNEFQDVVEGNLMRSLNPGAALEAAYSLYRACAPRLIPGCRVIELGCWTGGLASFIAARHPGCSVTGVDLARNVIAACESHYDLPNLRFRRWNYKFHGPQDVDPADVLLCSMGVVHERPDNTRLPDPCSARRSAEYARQRQQALGYFGPWRAVARDGGILLAMLRLPVFPRFLAWMDAAQQAGWTPRLDRLWHVHVPDEKVEVPGFLFEAAPCGPLAEEAVLDRWTSYRCRGHLFGRLDGAVALTAYRAVGGREVLARREYHRDGVLSQDEVGRSGGDGVGYVFTHNALSEYRLLLVANAKAQELAAGISAPGSSTPISDEGEFQEGGAPSAAARPGYAVHAGAVFAGTPIRAPAQEDPSTP